MTRGARAPRASFPKGAPAPVAWDAEAYQRLAQAQFDWALEVMQWRSWTGTERVLDAGCGPGRVASELLRRWPGVQVVAVDSDAGMLAKARASLAPFGLRAAVAQSSVTDLPALAPVDVVLCTAVLHWVPDHAAAFRAFLAALRPGGELLLQCGGHGNLASLVQVAGHVAASPPFAAAFAAWAAPWRFERAKATRQRLEQTGFAGITVGLEPKPTPFAGRADFLAFCQTAPLRPYLAALPEAQRPAFIQAVGDAWEAKGLPWSLDYVRLNVRARRPDGAASG